MSKMPQNLMLLAVFCLLGSARFGAAQQTSERITPACPPVWLADQAGYRVETETAMFLTHFTQRLDKRQLTRPALQRLVQRSKEDKDCTLLYLHEPFSPNGIYFYPDCQPDAYIRSSIGHFDFDSSKVQHAIVAGGLYELCLNNTVSQILQNWLAASTGKDLRITYVTDAVYGVGSDSKLADPFDRRLQSWLRSQPDHVVILSDILEQLVGKEAWTFLARRYDRVPADVGLYVEFRGELTAIQFASDARPTVTFAFATVDSLPAGSLRASKTGQFRRELATADVLENGVAETTVSSE